MGSEGEIWRQVKEQVRAKRQSNARAYLELLQKSGHIFTVTNGSEQLMFREPGKPPVDFWPSTGRWRIPKAGSKTHNGGATSFLAWYRKQVADD